MIIMPKKITTPEYKKAWLLGFLMFEYLPGVMPKASIAEKRKVADEALLVCAGKRPRMTPELLAELFSVHGQCVFDQQGKCALTVFVKPLAWEINKAMGVANEEDRGFKRHDPMCAAKPLSVERFDREGE